VLPGSLVDRADRAAAEAVPSRVHDVAAAGVGGPGAVPSVPPGVNLPSPPPARDTPFASPPPANTHGPLGAAGERRVGVGFEGAAAASPSDPRAVWREYEFPAKPGNPKRRPPIVAPYQPRLDWAIWFAAMASPREYPWTLHFVWKLLHNDPGTRGLLANDPFP